MVMKNIFKTDNLHYAAYKVINTELL